ncbi:signal peptidase I [Brevundimonas variabilis]|uniref:Signal peptidase I n=1 Tax=Brevundimonas variabilis TaxID=74312 RepID=A0A7W9CHL2_9CAUL|nr:signal peptidase I [Brevundimonas variabilis]MBB5745770.1 signal peptidase I [Brevundimonas variabilis]
MTQTQPFPRKASTPAQPSTLVPWFRDVGIAVCGALAFQTAVLQPFTIPSASMEPGLVVGDYIVVSKFAYGWSQASLPFDPPLAARRLLGRLPARGDVVVFRRPSRPREIWIKRAIALPGDRVEIRQGEVIVNARPLPQTLLGPGIDVDMPLRPVQRVAEQQPGGRRYVIFEQGPDQPGDDRAPIVVPDGFVFVMGDHRDNSLDSRWPGNVGVGLLPLENIVGRADIVVASWHPGAAIYKPWTWFDLRSGRFLKRIR